MKEKCDLYDPKGGSAHGFWHSDDGWVCEEFDKKDDPIVEEDEDQRQLF